MAYPLIILGAGASFDSVKLDYYSGIDLLNLNQFRPPLMNDLFNHSRDIFERTLRKYPQVNSLGTYALSVLADGKVTLEEHLQNLLESHGINNQERDPEVFKELISINYYLADLFNQISEGFYIEGNNYRTLIRSLQRNKLKAYVINFNYDLLFEKSLKIDIGRTDSYLEGGIKILKIHGANNWVYTPIQISGNYDHAQKYFAESADVFMDFFTSSKIEVNAPSNYLKKSENGSHEAYMPALALPLNKKSKHVCPPEHMANFEKNLPGIDRVLIIGWRGADSYIKEKLKNNLGERRIHTFVVSLVNGDYKEDELSLQKSKIRDQYGDVPQLYIPDENIFIKGFSGFMENESFYSRVLGNLPTITNSPVA